MSYEWNSDGVRRESTGWRDRFISQWHRKIGFNAPAMDIDGIGTEAGEHEGAWIEYDHHKPVVLMEYKTVGHTRDRGKEKLLSEVRPLQALAELAGLPAYLVSYDEEHLRFAAISLTEHGEQHGGDAWMSEIEFAEFLYRVRGRQLPSDVRARLGGQQ